MDILQAIVHSQANYLDDGVLKLLASELKKVPAGSKLTITQSHAVLKQKGVFKNRHERTRA